MPVWPFSPSRLLTAAAGRARLRAWSGAAAAVGLGAAALLAVVAADGRPVVFADTNIYIWMGRMQLRPLRYALAPVLGGPASAAQDPDVADEPPAQMGLRHTEMAARSPWFGLVLYVTTALGSLWGYAALQALAASYAVRTLWRAAGGGGGALEHLGVMTLLATGATLPFFAGFAMPDLWAGVGLAALATLLFLPEGLGHGAKAALFLLVLAALSFHQSNALAAAPAAAAAVLAARALWGVPWRRMAPGLWLFTAALAAAAALQAGYAAAIWAATGDTIRSPPFLAARILADGPGRDYLRRSCAQGAPWALCRFRNLPLDDSQDILWSGDPAKGVFGRAGVEERIRMDREQTRFVLAAIAADPAGSARAALANAWKTLTSVTLEDPLRDPHFYLTDPDWRDTYIADLVHDLGPCDPDERGCRPRFDPGPLALWHGTVCLAAVAWLAWAACGKRTRQVVLDPRLGPVILFLLAAVVFNAAVTGVLSGPFARYQARIAWLVPLCALLGAGAVLRRSRSSISTPTSRMIRPKAASAVK
jgi:hypothetical protein